VAKGYAPITESVAEDIFVVGYPKSGNTWFQNLIAGLVYGVDARWSPPTLANDLVPDVANAIYRRYATPTYFKSHALPLPHYQRVIYLLRDGRDAMVSYWHFLQGLHRSELDFKALVETGLELVPCKWHEHVEAWQSNPYDADLLVIRYEDLVQQAVVELERFCRFAGISREPGFLRSMAEAASFKNLRAKEARLGMGQPDRWPADRFFFRRGEIGSYKDEMPRQVLEAFLKDAAPTLERCGYPVFGDTPVLRPAGSKNHLTGNLEVLMPCIATAAIEP
jgi:hypothetical protein